MFRFASDLVQVWSRPYAKNVQVCHRSYRVWNCLLQDCHRCYHCKLKFSTLFERSWIKMINPFGASDFDFNKVADKKCPSVIPIFNGLADKLGSMDWLDENRFIIGFWISVINLGNRKWLKTKRRSTKKIITRRGLGFL